MRSKATAAMTVRARVIRADGTIEYLGVIAKVGRRDSLARRFIRRVKELLNGLRHDVHKQR